MITIQFDMDGCLVDYDSYWGTDKTFNRDKFKHEVMNNKMFENLLPLEKGVNLFWDIRRYCSMESIDVNFQILSSLGSPKDIELAEEACRQKTEWVRGYFGDFIGNLNFVEHKGKKKHFATPTTILIDDTENNVWDFNECHGHGILFNSQMDYETIKQEVFCTIDLVNNMIERGIY